MPVTAPVAVLKLNPLGRLGLTANVSVPNPPCTVTGVKLAVATNWFNTLLGTAAVVVNAGYATNKSNVLLLVCDRLSVTFTVYVALDLIAVGVPDTCPLVGLKLNPAGNAGLIANVNVPYPPLAVTGVKGDTNVLIVNASIATVCIVIIAGGAVTVSVKILLEVCAIVSVIVTVYRVLPLKTVGVPVTAPVAELKLNPAGIFGLIPYVKAP